MSGRRPRLHGIKRVGPELQEKSSYFLFLLLLAASLPRSSGVMHREEASTGMHGQGVRAAPLPASAAHISPGLQGMRYIFMI